MAVMSTLAVGAVVAATSRWSSSSLVMGPSLLLSTLVVGWPSSLVVAALSTQVGGGCVDAGGGGDHIVVDAGGGSCIAIDVGGGGGCIAIGIGHCGHASGKTPIALQRLNCDLDTIGGFMCL